MLTSPAENPWESDGFDSSTTTERASAPAAASIVTLLPTVPMPGYGVEPLAASMITSPSDAHAIAAWTVANLVLLEFVEQLVALPAGPTYQVWTATPPDPAVS